MHTIEARERLTQMANTYSDLLFSICLHMTHDYFAAQDLTQDSFLRAYRAMKSPSFSLPAEKEKAWLCRIATNTSIDYLRAAERRSAPLESEKLDLYEGGAPPPEDTALDLDERERLRARCRELKEPYGRVAYRYFYLEEKPKEIAEKTGVPLKTVQTQIYRAREMLRKRYADEMTERRCRDGK